MPRDLVPELHDIGKLTDLWQQRKRHTFEEFSFTEAGVDPTSPTWRGILEHHCTSEPQDSRGYNLYPMSPDALTCCLADSLASAVSRDRLPGAEEQATVGNVGLQRIWGSSPKHGFPFVPAAEAVHFVEKDPTADDFFHAFGELLRQRAEDTRLPITSLLTHAELTGKFYRLLKRAFKLREDELGSRTRREIGALLNEKRNEWRLTLAALRPNMLIKPFRTRDLGVFTILGSTLRELMTAFADNILFCSPEIVVLVAERPEIVQSIESFFLTSGFWLEITQAPRSIGELMRTDLMGNLGAGARSVARFPALPEYITPPICEGCQMAPAAPSGADGPTVDELCDVCTRTRDAGHSLVHLAGWENELVCWLHVKLDFEKLLREALPQLLAKYASVPRQDVEIRFTLVAEFQRDYEAFLCHLGQHIHSRFGERAVEKLLPSLLCIRIDEADRTFDLLGLYYEATQAFFSNLANLAGSPVRLGLSCSSAKFPFFEHWRVLENPPDDVFVNLVGKGRLKAPLKALPHVVTAAKKLNRGALYNLAEVARVSESLAKLKVHDQGDTESSTYRSMRELLPLGLDYQSLLTLSQLAGA